MITSQLLLCLIFNFQATETPHALFEIRSLGLRLAPERATVLLGNEVAFQLRYDGELAEGTRLKANLTGPGLATPYQVDVPASRLKIILSHHLFTAAGIYRLTHVRLEHQGNVLTFASPRNAEIHALDEILVNRVEVRELEREELAELGYAFNPNDYHSVNFSLALVVGAVEVPVEVPVAYPKSQTSSFSPVVLRDPFGPAISVKPMALQRTAIAAPNYYQPLVPPRIPKPQPLLSLLLIPGNFSYLKTQFQVTCVALNTADSQYDIHIDQLKAELKLPDPGRFGWPLSLNENPVKDVIFAGADGRIGTADDRTTILLWRRSGSLLYRDRRNRGHVHGGGDPQR